MNWVWEHSPTAGTELLTLLAIADNANDRGEARPSIATLAAKTRLDERTVQRVVRRLADAGQVAIVSPGGGRRANRYLVRMDVAEAELSTPPAERHPRQAATGGESPGQGRHSCVTSGVAQLCHPRGGVAVSPEPSLNRPRTSPSGDAPEADGGAELREAMAVLDRLGPAWRLTAAQRTKLAPTVVAALAAGWSGERLAGELGADPAGVRSPFAVLLARLSELPPPETEPAVVAAAPAWCGQCESADYRWVEVAAGRWARCPQCNLNRDHDVSLIEEPGRSKPPSTHRPGSDPAKGPLPTREEQDQCPASPQAS